MVIAWEDEIRAGRHLDDEHDPDGRLGRRNPSAMADPAMTRGEQATASTMPTTAVQIRQSTDGHMQRVGPDPTWGAWEKISCL
ncbi:hypothetical protein ACLOJK_004542 [Asimina triloba]